MNDPATFIMSLDCEGKWGMADNLQPYHDALTDKAITSAYDQLIGTLGRYNLHATFAFVMAFALSPEERRRFDLLSTGRARKSDRWLEPYWAATESGRIEGWHSPEAFDLVRSSPGHEIACHSFCHRPLGSDVDPAEAEAELHAADEAAKLKKIRLSTFVFPRNDVGNLEALRKYGYLGYRERLARPAGLFGKALSLATEFNTDLAPQPENRADGELIAIPAGRFFNWRFGARRRVPESVTVARWSNLLRRTAREGGVAHLWLHPHNLITGPGTGEVLERVLAEVAELQARGELKVETQEQYCRRLREAKPGNATIATERRTGILVGAPPFV